MVIIPTMVIIPIMGIVPIMAIIMRPPGLAMVAICLLLAITIHDSTAKAKPSSKFLLIKTKDSDEGREGGEDYADSNEPATGPGRYGGECTMRLYEGNPGNYWLRLTT